MTLEEVSCWLAIAGTVAFAVTAALAIADRSGDMFGVVVLGGITAVGDKIQSPVAGLRC